MSDALTEEPDREPSAVDEAKLEALRAREVFREDKYTPGAVSLNTRELLARKAAQYYDALWEYKDARQDVYQAWESSEVDKINAWDRERVEFEAPAAGDAAASQTITRCKLVAADPEWITEKMKQLDLFARQLGFAAEVDTGRQKGRIGADQRYESDE